MKVGEPVGTSVEFILQRTRVAQTGFTGFWFECARSDDLERIRDVLEIERAATGEEMDYRVLKATTLYEVI